MKKLDKIEIIEIIGRELQDTMKFVDIDNYFKSFGVRTDHQPSYNSKYVYVKEVLSDVNEEIIVEMAIELEIKHDSIPKASKTHTSEATFWKPGHFKLFISHLASFKTTIGYLKNELEKYGISAFVAHEDIEPTKQWQDEIEKGLFSMNALCAVLMPGFKESNWTDQEVGVAIGRQVLIISIRRGLDPYGFIGKYQGYQAIGKNVDQVAEEIFKIVSTNEKTKAMFLKTLSDLILFANSSDLGLERLKAFKKIENLPLSSVEDLRNKIVDNQNLKNAKFVKSFNSLADIYFVKSLNLNSFDKIKETEYDDLPF